MLISTTNYEDFKTITKRVLPTAAIFIGERQPPRAQEVVILAFNGGSVAVRFTSSLGAPGRPETFYNDFPDWKALVEIDQVVVE